MSGGPFVARYGGKCSGCGDPINVGDMLRWVEDVAVHDNCAARAFHAPDAACRSCWLTSRSIVDGLCPDCRADE